MPPLKVTTWNVQHLNNLTGPNLTQDKLTRRAAVLREILAIAPDILCILEGPKGEPGIDDLTKRLPAGTYMPVKLPNPTYHTLGNQWIWFLVKSNLAARVELLHPATWDKMTAASWPVHYWGDYSIDRHHHYRHPQVLILHWHGSRIKFVGVHLKSKFVHRGSNLWHAGGEQRAAFIHAALKARIKLATEAANVRQYIDATFELIANPAIFVLGDLNDGPGKDLFERDYLFFDLVSNLQGNIFSANRSLNHALFDYPQHLRWSASFRDFTDVDRDPKILLDHIFFTQPLVDRTAPLQVQPGAGFVEHEVHDRINASLTSKQQTSDHKPISVILTPTPPCPGSPLSPPVPTPSL